MAEDKLSDDEFLGDDLSDCSDIGCYFLYKQAFEQGIQDIQRISSVEMESKVFKNKCWQTFGILGGSSCLLFEDVTDSFGLLDIIFLGLPRFLIYCAQSCTSSPWWLSESPEADTVPEEPWYATVARYSLKFILSFLFWIQACLAGLLTFLCLPLIGLISWLYPFQSAAYSSIHDLSSTTGRDRRRWFFNSSTWFFFFILVAGLSLLLQSVVHSFFLNIATAYFITQTTLIVVAGLCLGAAILSVVSDFYEKSHSKKIATVDPDHGDYAELSAVKNSVVEYFNEFFIWCAKHKGWAALVIGMGVVFVLAAIILTVGFYTQGFGLFDSHSFDFMLKVFDFISNGFLLGLQGASQLPGLEFLGQISDVNLIMLGHVVSGVTLFLVAIFLPDNIRRLVQTFVTNDSKEEDIAQTENAISINKPPHAQLDASLFSKLFGGISEDSCPSENNCYPENNYHPRVGEDPTK